MKYIKMNIKIPVNIRHIENRKMSLKRPIPPGSDDIWNEEEGKCIILQSNWIVLNN